MPFSSLNDDLRNNHQLARYGSWSADEYYRSYYGQEVLPDDRAMLKFHTDFLKNRGEKGRLALEFGCGPTLLRAIYAAKYVHVLDMADRLESDVAVAQAWVDKQQHAYDWSKFTKFVVLCESMEEVTPEEVEAREKPDEEGRPRSEDHRRHEAAPVGERAGALLRPHHHRLLPRLYFKGQGVWKECMRNVQSMLQAGGSVLLTALDRSKAYLVGEKWVPAATIDADDLRAELVENGFGPHSINIQRFGVPEHGGLGYEGILLASARKTPCLRLSALSQKPKE
jgi:hypothetical protein